MSEELESKFLNTEGIINTLKIDVDNNVYTVEDNTGKTFAKYFEGNWDSLDKLYTNQILENKDLYNNNVEFLFNGETKKNKDRMKAFFGIKPKQSSITELIESSEAIRNVDIPKDPEGFFIGRYPINQKETDNFDFLKITCYDYEPGLMQGGSGGNLFKIDDIDKRIKKRRGVVSLPMQPGISESNSVDWGEDQINPLQMAGANLAGTATDTIANAITGQGFDLSGLIGSGLNTANAALGALDPNLIKAYFAKEAIGANIIARSTGLTINNNLEVLFNGPQLRTFSYNYRFTPREPKEADKIKQIIRFFKKSMAPKRSNSRIFLKSPNVFKLKYTYKNGDSHPFLNNIKICALNNFTVDYTPDGSYSTYEDDGGRGDGSMTSYQVSLGFKEMTPIYNDDFWNDDEGQEGTGF